MLEFLNENPFSQQSIGTKFELKVDQFLVLFQSYFVLLTIKRKEAIKVLQIIWTLTLVALNVNMLYTLIISWIRSKLRAKLIISGLIFSFLISQRGMSQIYWKKRSSTRHLLIFNESHFFYHSFLMKNFLFCHSSRANFNLCFDLWIIIFDFDLEFIVSSARFSLKV